MSLRPFLVGSTSGASYLFGCTSLGQLGVVDPHIDLVETYVEAAAAIGSPIVAVFETHVQADHISGLPALVARTGATAYLPEHAGVDFDHRELAEPDELVANRCGDQSFRERVGRDRIDWPAAAGVPAAAGMMRRCRHGEQKHCGRKNTGQRSKMHAHIRPLYLLADD